MLLSVHGFPKGLIYISQKISHLDCGHQKVLLALVLENIVGGGIFTKMFEMNTLKKTLGP